MCFFLCFFFFFFLFCFLLFFVCLYFCLFFFFFFFFFFVLFFSLHISLYGLMSRILFKILILKSVILISKVYIFRYDPIGICLASKYDDFVSDFCMGPRGRMGYISLDEQCEMAATGYTICGNIVCILFILCRTFTKKNLFSPPWLLFRIFDNSFHIQYFSDIMATS